MILIDCFNLSQFKSSNKYNLLRSLLLFLIKINLNLKQPTANYFALLWVMLLDFCNIF